MKSGERQMFVWCKPLVLCLCPPVDRSCSREGSSRPPQTRRVVGDGTVPIGNLSVGRSTDGYRVMEWKVPSPQVAGLPKVSHPELCVWSRMSSLFRAVRKCCERVECITTWGCGPPWIGYPVAFGFYLTGRKVWPESVFWCSWISFFRSLSVRQVIVTNLLIRYRNFIK